MTDYSLYDENTNVRNVTASDEMINGLHIDTTDLARAFISENYIYIKFFIIFFR